MTHNRAHGKHRLDRLTWRSSEKRRPELWPSARFECSPQPQANSRSLSALVLREAGHNFTGKNRTFLSRVVESAPP